MITGYKPNGYFVAGGSGDGVKVEGETRQCVHCQYTWEYRPGSGETRGWCMKCNGLVCGRAECAEEQRRMLATYPKTASCMPFTDLVKRQLEALDHDSRYEVLPSGIVIDRR